MTELTEAGARLLLRGLEEAEQVEKARLHPAYLLEHTSGVDAKTGEPFEFRVGEADADNGWFWQRIVLDWWLEYDKSIILKARQLGITWLAGGYGLWLLLYRPGTRVLCVSINEDEAAKLVNRVWDMYEALPYHLRKHVRVLKPTKGHRPHTEIQFQHPNGQISTIVGLPSTKKAGHGETAALVILDEASRQEYARETWKAVLPTMAGGGKIFVISTANGVSNELTGEGNFFHHLWVNAKPYQLSQRFLRWDLHPDRDEEWYRKEAMSLPAKDRAEQFPADEHEAFILTGDLYFDEEALHWYGKHGIRHPIAIGSFRPTGSNRAILDRGKTGWIEFHREPEPGHDYAIFADVATGRGLDYSAAYVIDLSDMALCAELHGKLDADQYAFQLHYLGRYYNTARIAIETGGGYGEAPIIFLRDGKDGRPAYPKMYRHRQASRPDFTEHKPFGFPMSAKTRPLVLEGLSRALRDRELPWITPDLLTELRTFVHRETNPSPRAQDGCNDDRVMALAGAVEMFRQYGRHAPKRNTRKPKNPYPWQQPWS